jgi:hypothetical protein
VSAGPRRGGGREFTAGIAHLLAEPTLRRLVAVAGVAMLTVNVVALAAAVLADHVDYRVLLITAAAACAVITIRWRRPWRRPIPA